MEKTITLKKIEYQKLKQIKDRFEIMRNLFESNFFEEPPAKNAKKIITEFKKTGLYKKSFLDSLKKGLKESSYFSNE